MACILSLITFLLNLLLMAENCVCCDVGEPTLSFSSRVGCSVVVCVGDVWSLVVCGSCG